MNIVRSRKGRLHDIDSHEGARAFLEDEGVDIENAIADAMIFVWELKKKLKSKIENEKRNPDQKTKI